MTVNLAEPDDFIIAELANGWFFNLSELSTK